MNSQKLNLMEQNKLSNKSEGSDYISNDPSFGRIGILKEQIFGLPETAQTKLLSVCKSVLGLAGELERFTSLCGSTGEAECRELSRVRKIIEDILSEYFTCLVYFLKEAEEEKYVFLAEPVDYSRAVEVLYLLGCERDKQTYCYLIDKWHPVRVMNKLLDRDLEQLLGEHEKEKELLQSVFADKNRNRRQIKLFCRNQVYETLPEDLETSVKAYPFRQKKGNTEIPFFRIWEKLQGYRNRYPSIGTIRVAVFGELSDDKGVLNELLLSSKVSVEWLPFENAPLIGEYYYQDVSGGQTYDLSNMEDIREMIRNYHIILFLDVNCLYRQWQSAKTPEERNEGSHCQWYLERSRGQTAFKEKAAYYRSIYDHVGLWLNSLRRQNSSSFEFDSLVFRNLTEAVEAEAKLKSETKPETDIYLYIKDGNRIASCNLEYSGVCNDENYGGRQLLVYKVAPAGAGSFNQEYRKFLQQKVKLNKAGYAYVPIKFWKIIKSISNEYCNYFLTDICEERDISQSDLIKILNEAYLVLFYKINADEKKIELGYDIFIAEPDAEWKNYLSERLKKLSEAVLEYALETENLYCVRRYFKEILINSIIVNAGNISDLVFAHIWSQPWMKTDLKGGMHGEDIRMESNGQLRKHKLNKTISVIIERMENLRMRSVSDMREYILETFRKIVSSEVERENFEETLHCIAECCREFRHMDSSLFLNSTLIDRQEA